MVRVLNIVFYMPASSDWTFDFDCNPLRVQPFDVKPGRRAVPSVTVLEVPLSTQSGNERARSPPARKENTPDLGTTFEPLPSWDILNGVIPAAGVTITTDAGKVIRGPPVDKCGRLSREDYLKLIRD
jgi:hypothetical protein